MDGWIGSKTKIYPQPKASRTSNCFKNVNHVRGGLENVTNSNTRPLVPIILQDMAFVSVCVPVCVHVCMDFKEHRSMLDWHASSEHLGQREIGERSGGGGNIKKWLFGANDRARESETLKRRRGRKWSCIGAPRRKRQGTQIKRGRLPGRGFISLIFYTPLPAGKYDLTPILVLNY